MKIDKTSDIPIYLQIYDTIKDEIINGYLMPEERIPSRRTLAQNLDVAQRTVENAYQKLLADGYITARQGSGYYVSADNVWDEEHQELKSRVYNFSSNGVETSKLPFAEWSKLLRITAKENSTLFQHGEKAGEWCLRKSIRRMLFRTQGIKCKTEQIIIGTGAEDLLREIVLLFADDCKFLMNNYFYYRVYNIVKELRIDMDFIINGTDGIHIDDLKKYDCGLLYLKPTHDLPTAVTLSEEKRREIVDWARADKYVIEDSDENCYCYGERIKTLWELSGGKNVIYLGSFSKTIAPSMKIGYIVLPDDLAALWFEKKRFYSNHVSRVEQVTLSKFIDYGYYEKHLNYMRDIYHEKAKVLRKAVSESKLAQHCTITGDDAGMFCVMQCDIPVSEDKGKKMFENYGIKMSSVATSVFDRKYEVYPPNTYIIGYGDMTITQIREGVAQLAKAWEHML